MNARDWFVELSEEVSQALYEQYAPTVQGEMEQRGLEAVDVFPTQVAYSMVPKPMTAGILLERTPYMAETAALSRLAGAAERGALTAVAEGAYELTDKGREFAIEMPEQLKRFFGELQPRPASELERLAGLLRRLVDASLEATEPADKAALTRSRFYDPGSDAPVLERIRRYLNDLDAFRDDVHVASWRHHDVEGYEWEAFSHIWAEGEWKDRVSTAAEVAEKFDFRGYGPADYETALRASVRRGWLAEDNGAFAMTEFGDQLRREAEEATDNYFFAPWEEISAEEASELRELLTHFRDSLQPEKGE